MRLSLVLVLVLCVPLFYARGAHAKYIQEQAGHSSIQVTMDTYGHLFPSQNREWVNKLDEPVSAVDVPATYPAADTLTYLVEPRSDKPLDSEGKLVGGGDPDRTGDPRLR